MSSSYNQLDFNKVTFLVLTGGSRGIGATIAIEFARRFAKGSQILLLARTSQGLADTKRKIGDANADVNVLIHSIDLTNPSEEELKKVLQDSLPQKYEQAIVVHNVGSTGDVSKRAVECNDMHEWKDNFSMNVFSVVLLNNLFVAMIRAGSKKQYIINITSKAAIEAFRTFAFYCPNKAAREMFFNVVAQEEPDLVVLSYAPGPVDTQMLRDVEKTTFDENFRNFVAEGLVNGAVLTTGQTVSKLIGVLEKGAYKSGDHVDYYDADV